MTTIKVQKNNNTIQGDSQEVGNFLGGELVLGTW